MSYTVESLQSPNVGTVTNQPTQFNLPERVMDPRDPSTIPKSDDAPAPDVKQTASSEGDAPEEAATSESVTLSPQISAIARKEQAQRQREQSLKRREQALEAKLKNADKFENLEAKIKAKDFSSAEELGLTYEEYTQYLLTKEAAKNPEEQRFRDLDKKLAEIKQAQDDLTNREYQANQGLWKAEISRVISESTELPLVKKAIKTFGPKFEADILDHINTSFEEDGLEISAADAAAQFEEVLRERASFYKDDAPQAEKKRLGPPGQSSPKTITQQMTTSSKAAQTKPFHLMSESEQLAEAIRRVQAAKQNR